MVKMYQHTKNEVSMSRGQKLQPEQTDTQTHRHDRKHYLPAYAGGNKLKQGCAMNRKYVFQIENFSPQSLSR